MAKIPLTSNSGVIGVDEAGRGPLAGPVVAAAVVLPESFDVAGLGDSKKLSRTQRETQAIRIRAVAQWHIELAGPDEIDRLNILWATMAAMERAVSGLNLPEAPILIDGNRVPNRLKGRAEAVIKGDGSVAAIAAASILAKTYRDKLMTDLADVFPGYGFEEHFGYPTPLHLDRLNSLGPCPLHRRSFAPVASLLAQAELPFAG